MAYDHYQHLRVLIVDDFDSFRSTLAKMLRAMGVLQIDTAADGAEALAACDRENYDLILCDYNLGTGKNGQQVLEDLRFRAVLRPGQLFVLLSTESSKNIVLASYDSQPDAYLTKPITARTLEQRLDRLLVQREIMSDVFAALGQGDLDGAIEACENSLSEGGRAAVACQKLLGELYLQGEYWDKAERLYTRVLEARNLDWAEVGLANVRLAQGDYATSAAWLKELLARNPMCMPAYDSLAETYRRQGDVKALQGVLADAVTISPIAIQRQQRLAIVAKDNMDVPVAAKAYRQAVKLGDHSCYHKVDHVIDFGRMSAELFSIDEELAFDCADDALGALSRIEKRFSPLQAESQWQAFLTQVRLHAGKGDADSAKKILLATQTAWGDQQKNLQLDTELDLAQSFFALGEDESAKALLHEMVEKYRDNEAALQRIDHLLEEPVSRDNRAMVAQINQDGIAYYRQKKYREAVGFFRHAHQLFPHHLGITLNLVQSMIGELNHYGIKEQVLSECGELIGNVEQSIKPTHAQFGRFKQLQEMFSGIVRKHAAKSS